MNNPEEGECSSMHSGIAIEFLEIFINSILYIRQVYPEEIFKKKRYYNSPVFISIYPPLNEYILNVLKTAKELKDNNELERVEIIIYKNACKIYENYIFEVNDKHWRTNLPLSSPNMTDEDADVYLIRFEEDLRKSLLLLSDRVKEMEKLPKDAQFKINLHTTQSGFIKMSNQSRFQDFPWLQERQNHFEGDDKSTISILPITYMNQVGLQIYCEQFLK